jgi:nucleoside-diphosphate-sugar epimerase
MRLFVTGATGFIGSHFVNHALSEGHEVVALRRTEESKPRVPLMASPKWVTASLDAIPVESFDGVDCVVHLAAHTANVPYDTLERCIYWNVTVPLAVFRMAHSRGVQRYVVAGSCFEYGKSGERYEFIPVDAPLEPVGSYPTSKAMASLAFIELARELNLKMSIHRIFQVYGEGENENRLWPSLRRAALAGEDYPMTLGDQLRDFIQVQDVATVLLAEAKFSETSIGNVKIKNIGSGSPVSVKEFCENQWLQLNAIGKLLPGQLEYRPNEIMRFVPKV